MLSLIKRTFKILIFVLLVLAIGGLIHWNGKTVSDHVATKVKDMGRGLEKIPAKKEIESLAIRLTSSSPKKAKAHPDKVTHKDQKDLKKFLDSVD